MTVEEKLSETIKRYEKDPGWITTPEQIPEDEAESWKHVPFPNTLSSWGDRAAQLELEITHLREAIKIARGLALLERELFESQHVDAIRDMKVARDQVLGKRDEILMELEEIKQAAQERLR